MSINRIKGILIQELYITKHSLEVVIDLFYFSVVNVIVFGLFSTFISNSNKSLPVEYLLLGLILWEVIRVTQYSLSLASLWNIWSRNLSNMFVSPLSVSEYIVAGVIAGAIKAISIVILISLIAVYLFNFNVFKIGIANFVLFFVNLSIFAWSLGILIEGVIFRYGTRIQALAWGFVFLFQPLTAAFFPVKALPNFLQQIAFIFPPTYIFESARESLINPVINWDSITIAFSLNLFYFIFSVLIFKSLFNKSKETGQFARNEG